jgi:GT2 family glycosyltransferase
MTTESADTESTGTHRSAGDPSTPRRRRVAVVVVTYQSERHVESCFSSLRSVESGAVEVQVIAVDNGSSDTTVVRIRERFPEVALLALGKNLGFAGASNVGIERALTEHADFIYLLNPDTTVTPTFLQEAMAVMDRYPSAGAVQSLLLLASEPDRINTAGNVVHFLGFGYCGQYREPRCAAPPDPVPIAFASGAATLLRAEALRRAGLFDPALFLYQEDLDLGWRIRLAGFDNLLAPRSVVFHDYEFSRNSSKYYLIERNRYLVLLKNLSPRSLLALAPAAAAAEVAFVIIAAKDGWLPEKIRAMAQLLRPSLWQHVVRERSRVKALRRRTDREIVALHRSDLTFEGVTSPFIERVANPAMAVVWDLIRRAIV